MTEDLWTGGEVDDLDVKPDRRRPRVKSDSGRHIGCPLSWFKLVYPIVRGKGELAVALYLYRLRIILRSRTVKVSNERLFAELGVDRFTKYRALKRLAVARIIFIKRRGKQTLEVGFDRKHSKGSP
jgi:AAA+ ATPase superfamily predicted ATPase